MTPPTAVARDHGCSAVHARHLLASDEQQLRAKDEEIIRLRAQVTAWKAARTVATNRSIHWQHETEYLRRQLLQIRNKIDTLLKTHATEDEE